MKTSNRAVQIRVFAGFIAIDAVLLLILYWVHGHFFEVPWWIVNAPGIPLCLVAAPLLPPGDIFAMDCVIIGAALFSAFVWSLVLGDVISYRNQKGKRVTH